MKKKWNIIRWIECFYFHIYNTYYKDGNYKNDIPYFTAYVIVVAVGLFYTMDITMIGSVVLTGTIFPLKLKPIWYLASGIYFVLLYFLILRNNRYNEIYRKYKRVESKYRLYKKIGSWGFAALGVIIFLVLINILHKYVVPY